MYHILSISIVICQIKSHAFGYGHTRELGSRDKGMMGIRMQAGRWLDENHDENHHRFGIIHLGGSRVMGGTIFAWDFPL